jgi:hypothetical protein
VGDSAAVVADQLAHITWPVPSAGRPGCLRRLAGIALRRNPSES